MFDNQFSKGFYSVNSTIQEGYAYAISSKWFRNFKTLLMNPNGVDISKIGSIQNHNIYDTIYEIDPKLDGFLIPEQYKINFHRVFKLIPGLIYCQDYEIVSIDVWKFLKMYYNADYEVIVFVTKVLPGLKNYSFCDNLEEGLCVCNEIFYLVLVIVELDDKSKLLAIKMPACPWMDLNKFRTFLFSNTEYELDWQKFINHGHLYYDGKKVPFKGNKLLKDMGITKETQIILSCPNLTFEDIEEEIETDGEEQQVQQDLHTKQEFLEILEQNMKHQSNELILKSQQEIQQSLEQNDFFQV
ncbi:unnamed protein product (macronuclear) [Paramecium tetraurelia]|uniref:DUSP domain-containing protein n=1 Tax=Paramecium tetraurelia TaxID=5888 RepID=A0BHQ8_PARTE|nr:uncharacterized protein GSPATT00029111001 [Paramecium tetraurelia]CAK58075.1 unnamed protein product [Paramecium tetraurelia]|eukprot:XP_001425473.1 hypothetical protein (macronuclear) [Paramecium tetraurelia strain d4-2]